MPWKYPHGTGQTGLSRAIRPTSDSSGQPGHASNVELGKHFGRPRSEELTSLEPAV